MTTPKGENSGDRGEVFERTIDVWKHGLPEAIMDFYDDLVPPEKEFARYDEKIKELAGNEEWNKKVAENLHQNKDTNNFWMIFSSDDAEAALRGGEGMRLSHGYKPFYVNSRYNNAWSRMCEQFPEDLAKVMEYADNRLNGSHHQISDEEKESMSRLAVYLIEQEKILAWFLFR